MIDATQFEPMPGIVWAYGKLFPIRPTDNQTALKHKRHDGCHAPVITKLSKCKS